MKQKDCKIIFSLHFSRLLVLPSYFQLELLLLVLILYNRLLLVLVRFSPSHQTNFSAISEIDVPSHFVRMAGQVGSCTLSLQMNVMQHHNVSVVSLVWLHMSFLMQQKLQGAEAHRDPAQEWNTSCRTIYLYIQFIIINIIIMLFPQNYFYSLQFQETHKTQLHQLCNQKKNPEKICKAT